MPMKVVIGAQWGDEGKGKVVDLYSEDADVVARFGGGANAGHNIWVGGKNHVTHLLPSGIVRGKVCVLGAGMVIEPAQLLKEIKEFGALGIDVSPKQIMISPLAHIVLPTHRALDAAYEESRGKNKFGSTGSGIAPAYADNALHCGIQAGSMAYAEDFGRRAYTLAQEHNKDIVLHGGEPHSPNRISREYEDYAKQLQEYVHDTNGYLNALLREGKKTVLAEGAQGTLLDKDHGTYPYVSSSSTIAGGVATGLGISPRFISKIIGVVKCFQTRVGEGPMPTEIKENTDKDKDLANFLRGEKGQPGAEFGATTGRKRRVGWLDIPLLRYADNLNGFDELVLTKLDVLSGCALQICTKYKERLRPYFCETVNEDQIANLEDYDPQYNEWRLMGWEGNISNVRIFEDLPPLARAYVQKIVDLTGVPVKLISVGTDREQVIRCNIQKNK